MSDSRRARYLAACACLIAIDQAGAQGVCGIPDDLAVPVITPPTDSLDIGYGVIDYDGAGTTLLGAGIDLRYRDWRIVSEQARIVDSELSVEVPGEMSFEGEGLSISAMSGRLDRRSEELRVDAAELRMQQQGLTARGRADEIVVTRADLIRLRGLSFTTCPEDGEAWKLTGQSLDLNQAEGVGIVRGATLRLFNVPVFRAPYFSFPLDDRRKTGFLTPKISERDRTGIDLTVPYYLNLAPNYDLLLEPRLMEDRGPQIAARYRYLLPASAGRLRTEYLPDDRSIDQSRYFVTYEHESAFGERFELDTVYGNVSDAAYFEDLGDSLGIMSQINLDRFVVLSYFAPRWTLASRVQEYQTLAVGIAPEDLPHERLPQIEFAGSWGDRLLGFDSDAEVTYFDRTVGDTGWRIDTSQELSLRLARAGAWLTPAVGFRQTNYRVDAAPGGPARTHSRGLPIASIDGGLRFERLRERERSWIQTIEPRLLYVRIPFEDQSGLPTFDTILPDFNLVQLFSKYQFTGPDRIADTDRLSLGVTSRLIDPVSGREWLAATIGQTRFGDARRVMLPDESPTASTESNYVAELAISMSERWSLDVGFQWNEELDETVRARTAVEFRPSDEHLFAIGYRKREDLLEQGDFSMVWPVTDRWRLIGQYSYSLLEQKTLERFAGIEYEACCWRLQVTNHQYIVRSTGQTDSTFSIKFELLGLGERRATPEELLGRGIFGGSQSEF